YAVPCVFPFFSFGVFCSAQRWISRRNCYSIFASFSLRPEGDDRRKRKRPWSAYVMYLSMKGWVPTYVHMYLRYHDGVRE
ncbi:hypothetical protein F4677DRAFT_428898, partial [Hypoxylon crocopeplum]